MTPSHLVDCQFADEGVYLTFSDGKTFFLSEAFLFATRFTHGKLVRAPTPRPANESSN